ncbi:LGFP repeat-containing protein [Actinokineospora sp. HUAS TT18]|uniref:LGFP repeat-containing protein n=1 Tax=Actinokineospora sp. HUAS TT18 TaxID=3447451 RepID=UPI003F51B606
MSVHQSCARTAAVLALLTLGVATPVTASAQEPTKDVSAAVMSDTGVDAIKAKYSALGGGSPLEGPTTQADGTLTGFFRKWNTRVAITWHPDHGAHWFSGAIEARWEADLATAPHGAAVADQAATAGRPGAATAFARGASIYYSDGTGAHVLSGAVRAKYWALGATASTFGFPVTDVARTSGAAGTYANFDGAVTIHAADGGRGLWFSGELRKRFHELGGYAALGIPTTDQAPTPNNGWFFDMGPDRSMYWSAETGARVLSAEVHAKYLEFNSVKGPFGLPVTDVLATPDLPGEFAQFQNAVSIFWSKATGAHWISGALRQEFWDNGSLAGLGFPTSDQLPTAGVSGLYVLFGDDRAIIWGSDSGAHLVKGAILAKLRADGDVAVDGLPEYDEMDLDGTRRFQQFRQASIFTVPTGGAVTVRGLIRAEWWRQGGWTGKLGLPVADEVRKPDVTVQQFANGRIECRSTRCVAIIG